MYEFIYLLEKILKFLLGKPLKNVGYCFEYRLFFYNLLAVNLFSLNFD